MQPAQDTNRQGPPNPSYAQATCAASLTTLVYRSRATQPFSASELFELAKAAQERNRSESITGLMLYDDSRFFQWLEGPEENLSRLMHSIHNDVRHTDVDVLTRQQSQRRIFAGWDMKLAMPDAVPAPWTREVIRPSRETVETLRRRPEIAASVIESLASRRGVNGEIGTSAMLERVVRMDVIPQLVSQHRAWGPAAGLVSWDARASSLADLLLTGDTEAALAWVKPGVGQADRSFRLQGELFEMAARHLGDRWLQDECSEFEVTLGLCCLQTVVRRLEQDCPFALGARALAGRALVVAHAGEPHGLNAALCAQALRRADWLVQSAFPGRDAELNKLLAGESFDRLDISLSAAFRREDRLGAMATTIAKARKASRNPALVITVGGRIFAEQEGLAAEVGADSASNASRMF